jgi:protocatechuate 3,4-dioxygenase alpha subunit
VTGVVEQHGHQTPSQTVGPFFGYSLPYEGGEQLLPPQTPGTIRLHGTVYDGAGIEVPDAVVEIWQADADGAPIAKRGSLHRDGYTFTGFGRAAVDGAGHYSFTTIKPGAMRAGSAPYVMVTIFARGLLHHLFTRAYFADDERDVFLDSLGERASTLIADVDADGYRFDIHLQGEHETVFFDYGVDLGA